MGPIPQRAHRQVTNCLLPQTRGNWRRLERVLESQRQLYNAALQERSDAWRLAGVSLTWQDRFRSLTASRREIPEMAAVPVAIQRGVASLKRQGISSCVTVNGLLSLPGRHDALDRVRLGDASMLLISPQQLRNPSVRSILEQREVGYWVVDEAHCVSRWGHDFRPDYRYIARFIREHFGDSEPAPLICLTATAKPCHVYKRGSGQGDFCVVVLPHVTVPDQPHIAGRGGGGAHRVDPVP